MCVEWLIWVLCPIRGGAAISALELFSPQFPCSVAVLYLLHFMFTPFGTSLPGRALVSCFLLQSLFRLSKIGSFEGSSWAFYLEQGISTCRSLSILLYFHHSIFSLLSIDHQP